MFKMIDLTNKVCVVASVVRVNRANSIHVFRLSSVFIIGQDIKKCDVICSMAVSRVAIVWLSLFGTLLFCFIATKFVVALCRLVQH